MLQSQPGSSRRSRLKGQLELALPFLALPSFSSHHILPVSTKFLSPSHCDVIIFRANMGLVMCVLCDGGPG